MLKLSPAGDDARARFDETAPTQPVERIIRPATVGCQSGTVGDRTVFRRTESLLLGGAYAGVACVADLSHLG